MTAISTVYGFIRDELFWNKQLIDITKSIDTGLGYIDDIYINYFNKIGVVTDPREDRLDLFGEKPVGQMSVVFDASKLDDNSVNFSTMDIAAATKFMRILETAYMSQSRTEQELNVTLGSDATLTDFFVPLSLKRSTNYTAYKPASLKSMLSITDYVEFEAVINGKNLRFKLWINKEAFKNNYPLTSIVKIIPSCKPEYLIDPSSILTPIEAIVGASDFTFDRFHDGTYGVDYTGVLNFRTKWVISSQNTPDVKFAVLYQGAKPSSLEARAAIRAYLRSLGFQDSVWEARFPDLYVTAQFFIVPMWGNVVARPNQKYSTIYPAVANYKEMYTKLSSIFTAFTTEWFDTKMEVLLNPFNNMLSMAMPDPLNETAYVSLRTILETYQAYGPDVSNFDQQEEDVKDFARKLALAMSILYGNTVTSMAGYSTNVFYDRRFLSFTSNKIEYHVLYREDYTLTTGG